MAARNRFTGLLFLGRCGGIVFGSLVCPSRRQADAVSDQADEARRSSEGFAGWIFGAPPRAAMSALADGGEGRPPNGVFPVTSILLKSSPKDAARPYASPSSA